MEWIFVGPVLVALAVVVWGFYSLWMSTQELPEDESELEIVLDQPHSLFPWRKADDHTALSWVHRLRQDDCCEIRFPGVLGARSIVGAVNCGHYTLLLLADGVSTARVAGPMPVEIVRGG